MILNSETFQFVWASCLAPELVPCSWLCALRREGNVKAQIDTAGMLPKPDVAMPPLRRPGSLRGVTGPRARIQRLGRLVALLAPSIILIVVFSYYPALRSLVGGFTSWNGFGAPKFVGLAEFQTYISSPAFGAEMRNVLILIGGGIAISLISQFTAAEIVANLRGRAQTFVKYALALPMVIPVVVLVDIWAYLLTPQGGVIDTALRGLGLPAIDWLGNPRTALISILLIGFPWVSNLGFLIFLGGIQRLPGEVREAASLDGAGALRRIWKVDVPLLRPQVRVVVILSAIYAVQNFIPILLLTRGGPGNATEVPGLDMYQSAFTGDQYGYGMAIGTLMFAGMLLITLIGGRALRSKT